jgi:rhodanese-related sulfurtransferase
MREVPARIADLDSGKPLVVMCHSGGRSRRVAEFLQQNGFSNVFNLKGGIEAWSTQLDSRVPRY